MEAQRSYTRAVELNPDDIQVILGLASAQWSNGRSADAEETFKNALERLPQKALLYQNYGTMLVKMTERGGSSTDSRAGALLQRAVWLSMPRSQRRTTSSPAWTSVQVASRRPPCSWKRLAVSNPWSASFTTLWLKPIARLVRERMLVESFKSTGG